jgi:hypothetical protein
MRKETLKQKEAFEYYFLLGDTRTLKKVSRKCQISIRTAKRWSTQFNWQTRIQERENRLAEKIRRKIERQIVKVKEENLKVIEAAKIRFIENLKTGYVDPHTIQDLERIIKLELLILGENQKYNDNHITVISSIPRPSP